LPMCQNKACRVLPPSHNASTRRPLKIAQ
jgi:hypothetical protein